MKEINETLECEKDTRSIIEPSLWEVELADIIYVFEQIEYFHLEINNNLFQL